MLPRLSEVSRYVSVAVENDLTDAEVQRGILERWPGATEGDLATVARLLPPARLEGLEWVAAGASQKACRAAVAAVGRDPEAVVDWLMHNWYGPGLEAAQAQGVADLRRLSLAQDAWRFLARRA